MTEPSPDVIIVGGGPSGLFVGCELAGAGVNVLILEKRDGPTLPRAGNVQPRVLEIFDCRGLAEKVIARADEVQANARASIGIWAGFFGVRYDLLDTSYPYMVFLAQMETENILCARYRELGGDIRFKHEVTEVRQDSAGVEVAYTSADGQPHTLRCRYAVGADGGKSTVRETLGITALEEPEQHIAWGIQARTKLPFDYPISTVTNDRGWSLVYPHTKEITRFSVIDALTTRECNHTPTLDEMRAALTRIHGTDFGVTEALSQTTFGDKLLYADKMREGRVFLVGDSVRIHYPASGVGMNFALQDAFNLAWKLAAVVRGWGPEWLLDSYETERRPEVDRHMAHVRLQTEIQFNYTPGMMALKRFIGEQLLPMAEVNHLVASHLGGFLAKYPSPDGSPDIVGRRLVDQEVVDAAGGRRRLYELLRDQRFIYLQLAPGATSDLSAYADRVGQATASPVSDGPLADLHAVLVRPDGHVAHAWVGPPGDEDRRSILAHWCGLPAPASA